VRQALFVFNGSKGYVGGIYNLIINHLRVDLHIYILEL